MPEELENLDSGRGPQGEPGGNSGTEIASVDLSNEAIDWLVHLHSDEAGEADHAAFAAWRALSDEHEAAAVEAEGIWQGVGSLGEEHASKKLKERRRRRLTRRVVIGGGLTALVGLAGYRSELIGSHLFAQYATGTGERRSVRLKDGSTVHLNAETALSAYYTSEVRRLVLYRGQAVFEVANDVERPFFVEAGEGSTRALGTVFDVNITRQNVVVTVLEGVVGVSSTRNPGDYTTAEADQRLRYSDSGVESVPNDVDADMETAWRRGKLIFDQKPLGDVVNEIERQLNGRVVFANSDVRDLRVTGVFDLDEPQAVLDAIEYSLPVEVIRMPFVTVLR